MDKVNMSIAILPMAQEFDWSSAEMGIIQSSFFAGYILSNIPGGYLASRLGGRRVLPVGLGIWSLATAMAPLMAASTYSLGFSRSMVGLGQAVAPTSVVDMLARVVRKEERASSVSLAFAGLHVGSIVGLLAAPAIIQALGWRTLFVIFGVAGLAWYLAFEALMQEVYEDDPETAAKLSPITVDAPRRAAGDKQQEAPPIPYRAFVRATPVQALCFTHFANNWFHYSFLSWVPAYFKDTLHLHDLGDTAHTSVVPPLAGILCSVLAGPIADRLVASGSLRVPQVRKLMQGIAMLGPAACLAAASLDMSGPSNVPLITIALGLSSFSLAGFYCTHSDMSPKYAGAMLGLTNTSGALAGILGVAAVGLIHDATNNWAAALLVPNIVLLSLGAYCYTIFCRNEAVDFDSADNSPYAFEAWLEAPRLWAVQAVQGAFAALERVAHAAVPQPPREVIAAARRERLATIRASAAASFDDRQQIAGTGAPRGMSAPSFASLVTTSLSGYRESINGSGLNGSQVFGSQTLVSQWTMATLIPDYETTAGGTCWEEDELAEAEEEVARIMSQMKPKDQEKGGSMEELRGGSVEEQ